jgi:predicted Zn-dependent peptidase
MFARKKLFVVLISIFSILSIITLIAGCSKDVAPPVAKAPQPEADPYPYKLVEGDPLNARIYTLDNGLKVYMTVYKDAPRIQTAIAIRVGSKYDPKETTGLAHYLEHLLFKGTDEYGTIDYAKEKVLIDQVIDLFEVYRTTADTLARKEIYQQIDSLSYEASKYAIAGEYDKMLSAIGAKGTNAFTGNEQTVYINDIPSNQIEKWLKIEAERFNDPVMRLFHTELEVVYEEKNRSMDNDRRKLSEALNSAIYPKHPYGTQTTLGDIEHLKNPSIQNVVNYFNTYYVPNNMAICLSGDFDPDSMIRMIDATFGKFEPKEVPPFNPPKEDPITEPVVKEVIGPDMESVLIGYRFPGAKSKEADLLLMTDYTLMNSVAGLIDLNLKQKQKVIGPYSYSSIQNDYSKHVLGGRPRQGQTLEEVKDLLLSQIELVKKGEFPDWLPSAVVNNLKMDQIRGYERNWGRTRAFLNAFIEEISWDEYINQLAELEKITKADIVNFANKYYGDNYVVAYKRTGEDKNVKKIVKPPITPVELNRQAQSEFIKSMSQMTSKEIHPVFIDFNELIEKTNIKGNVPIHYKKNIENELFRLAYLVDMGSNHDLMLRSAVQYLPYLGTSKYSPEEFKKELYKLGCSFNVWTGEDRIQISLSGLMENFEAGVELFEHLLADAQPHQEALQNLTKDILKNRADQKLNKGTILNSGMFNYGVYGKKSPFTNKLSEEQLLGLTPQPLIDKIKNITNYPHRILYYGPLEIGELAAVLTRLHHTPDTYKEIPQAIEFVELPTEENKIFICNYDMKQVEIIMLSKSVPYNKDNIAVRSLFNEYYGGSMASVVFQTLRESQALAYSVYGSYYTPRKKEDSHYIFSYIGTQADKLQEAMNGMFGLLNDMPQSEISFNDSKEAILEQIKTERITKDAILYRYESQKRMGNEDRDIRKDIYEQLPSLQMQDLMTFFEQYIKDKKYTILVLGDTEKLDIATLENFGAVKELSLEEVFGY